jgi:hypothetical protein
MKRLLAIAITSTLLAAALVMTLMATSPAHAAYTPPAIKVAVVWSQASKSWYERHTAAFRTYYYTDHKQEYAIAELKSRGWDVSEIHDADLSDLATLKKYDVVVLTYVFAMDPLPAQILRRYVAEGGGLVTMFASPRVAPAYDTSPRTVLPEHWMNLLKYRAWEWGPLTEAYQAAFVNDPTPGSYDVNAMPHHPIVADAKAILAARGYGSTDMRVAHFSSGGMEIPRLLTGNGNATTFATMRITDGSTWQRQYPGDHPAAIASNYYDGRAVYFYFMTTDFFPKYMDSTHSLWARETADKTPQGEIIVAYMEAALKWAADKSSHYGPIVKGGKTYASVKAFSDAIYVTQSIYNDGNSPTLGSVACRIYSPAGTLVYKRIYTLYGLEPGTSGVVKYQFLPGGLARGRYRVQMTYAVSYPTSKGEWNEEGYVRAGGLTGTTPMGTSEPTLSNVSFSPSPVARGGRGYVNYTADRSVLVNVRIYDSSWRFIRTAVAGGRGIGVASARVYATDANGNSLKSGSYFYKLQVWNSRGLKSTSAAFVVD